MRITIMQVLRDSGEERVTLGSLEFKRDIRLGEDVVGNEVSVNVSKTGESLVINATYVSSNKNLCVMVLCQNVHVFTAACHWGHVTPYFAFVVPSGAFIELFFEMNESS